MERFFLYPIAFIIALLIGCSRGADENQAELPGGSVTLWTSTSELFMEYPALVVGQEARFAIHLTWLSDFKPVTEGQLDLVFTSDDGTRRQTSAERPTSPGIFRPTITFDTPGTYRMTLTLDGRSRDTLHVNEIRVFASAGEVPPEVESPQAEQLITFLKEQQWKIDFRTEPVVRRRISGTVRAASEIIPKLHTEAIVSAPFSGVIPAENNAVLPVIGQSVAKGSHLALMVPSAETPSGLENFASRFIKAETDRTLAEKEFERAKQLRAIDGISEREYQEAEIAFKQADVTYRLLTTFVQFKDGDESLSAFILRAPISGTIIEANVVPGRQINAGEQLYRIIDSRAVWVRANVASSEIGRLTQPRRAWLRLAGLTNTVEVNERNGRLVSIATAIDPRTRSFPVIFETQNPNGSLRIGMYGEILIATGEEKEALVIPESALIEEEGRYSVYVHIEGEAFAKRDVTLGERNGNLAEIRSGITEGERVVTVGAYQVRLASLSTQVPAHGHEH
jgi:RND family efflux transporter MFP subunit